MFAFFVVLLHFIWHLSFFVFFSQTTATFAIAVQRMQSCECIFGNKLNKNPDWMKSNFPNQFLIYLNLFLFSFSRCSLSNSASFSDLQYFRHAATIAAVAAAALPPSPSSSTNPNNVPIGSLSAIGSGAPSAVDFHPAYRIPGYMEHLYSLQHSGASAASSLHGKIVIYFEYCCCCWKIICTSTWHTHVL